MTSSYICRNRRCEDCHRIYNTNTCPEDYIDIGTDKVMNFISKMTELLRLKDEEVPFRLDISDEDFLKLLQEAVAVDK